MKSLTQIWLFLLIATFSMFTIGCDDDEGVSTDDFGIFSTVSQTEVMMNGVIGSNTPQHWRNLIAAFPNVNKITMKECPGSEDDEANLIVSREIRNQGVSIHLPADAEIASGAVDLFLAGTTRTREAGSRIGVHSWSTGSEEATDFAVGHANHLPYINYYVEMGFSQSAAEAFYYFTINAAAAADIHWMTDEEIEQYGLLTP